MRLFVGVELPVPVVRLIRSLPRPTGGRLRWTTPDQWHVTLRFLGDVADPHAVAEAVATIPGTFGSGAVAACLGPATAWFGDGRTLHIPVTGVEELAGAVRDVTARWGRHGEPAFFGHVTLARSRRGHPVSAETAVGRDMRAMAGSPISARFDVREVALFASALGPKGAAYEIVSKVVI